MGATGRVKLPREQYDEITNGRGELVDWLKTEEVKRALLLREEAKSGSGHGDDAERLWSTRRDRAREGRA